MPLTNEWASHRRTMVNQWRPDLLGASALAYLAIPNLIFFWGWLIWPLALLLSGALVHLLLTQAPQSLQATRTSARTILVLAIVALLWAALVGGSHWFHADHDWVVRDAILGDLVRSPWPVVYSTDGGQAYILRSAIGYFLPAALWGKLFGTEYLALALHLWTTLGCLLFLWLILYDHVSLRRLLWGLVVILGFSGMDFPGLVLATQSLPIFPLRLEWWVPLSYPSLTGHLMWAPNHCLPSLICAALLLRQQHSLRLPGVMLAALPLSLIWSPFTIIGMLPLVAVATRRSWTSRSFWKAHWQPAVTAALVGAIVSSFLLIDAGHIVNISGPSSSPGARISEGAIDWRHYALFVLMEFGILGLLLLKATERDRHLLVAALLILFALLFIRLGPSNDLLIRSSAPALVILLHFSLRALSIIPSQSGRFGSGTFSVGTIIVLAVGMITPAFEIARAVLMPVTQANYTRTFAETQQGHLAPHYVGNLSDGGLTSVLQSGDKTPWVFTSPPIDKR